MPLLPVLRSCAWVVCSVYVLCGSSTVYASPAPSASASTVLYLCLVVRCSVCVYVCCACASSAFSVARLLFVCLGRLLHLRLLCLVRSIYVYVCCACALFTSSVARLLFICLGCLLRLRLRLLCLCLIQVFCGSFVCLCAWVAYSVCILCASSALSASSFAVPVPYPRLLWLVCCLCAWVVCTVCVLCASSAPSASSSCCVNAIGFF